jgi:hypothetical protein
MNVTIYSSIDFEVIRIMVALGEINVQMPNWDQFVPAGKNRIQALAQQIMNEGAALDNLVAQANGQKTETPGPEDLEKKQEAAVAMIADAIQKKKAAQEAAQKNDGEQSFTQEMETEES